jgi:hypothetical protein
VRSIKKKIELPGLCYSDALIGSNHHFRLPYFFFLFDRTVVTLTIFTFVKGINLILSGKNKRPQKYKNKIFVNVYWVYYEKSLVL